MATINAARRKADVFMSSLAGMIAFVAALPVFPASRLERI
jgi:hypothetical protein